MKTKGDRPKPEGHGGQSTSCDHEAENVKNQKNVENVDTHNVKNVERNVDTHCSFSDSIVGWGTLRMGNVDRPRCI